MIYYLSGGDISKHHSIKKMKLETAYKYYYSNRIKELNKMLDDIASIKHNQSLQKKN